MHAAVGLLQRFAGRHIVELGLLDAGVDSAACVEWQVELEADAGFAQGAIFITGTVVLVVGIGAAQVGAQIQGRFVTCLGQIDLLVGNILGDALGVQLQVAVFGLLHPAIGIIGQG